MYLLVQGVSDLMVSRLYIKTEMSLHIPRKKQYLCSASLTKFQYVLFGLEQNKPEKGVLLHHSPLIMKSFWFMLLILE